MNALWAMTKRNLRVFFRDRASVFFSLLALLIIIGLYIFFLGDMMVRGFSEYSAVDVRFMMDSWIMAGMMAVASITTTMGAYGTMVEDRARKVDKDFATTPVSRGVITGGHMLSTFFIGMIMCLLNLLIAEIYIVASGGELLSMLAFAQVLGVLLLSVLANSALVLFLTSFFRTTGSFGGASTVLGTLVGFLTGIYIPIGSLPGGVQWVIRCFPVSHAAALMRQVMMQRPYDLMLQGAPAAMQQAIRLELDLEFGVRFQYGSHISTAWDSVLVLLVTAVVFFLLSAWRFSRKRTL